MSLSDASFTRHVHLLYVPTLACNLGCSYCYLGCQTGTATLRQDAQRAAGTLRRALDAFLQAGMLPFNVSLHGGEPTVLPANVLEELFTIIRRHYLDYYDALNALGYRKSAPHLKTNLFTFHRLYELFDRHKVSVSASIDLPLALHARYRTDRRGRPWLKRTRENLRLLGRYPHAKKISATLYREHLEDIPALIDDIWLIHRELGFDMNNFNVMFGFESALNRQLLQERGGVQLHQADGELQVRFYEALKAAFSGTALEEGLRRHWFDEFTPSYCTNAFNCGERFYLVQGDGSVWSCVRGQGLEPFRYGNILTDPVAEIMATASRRIALAHQQQGLDPACRACPWLHICHTGCPVVKQQRGSGRSYTCELQQAIYRDHPRTWPPLTAGEQAVASREYILGLHPSLALETTLGGQSAAQPATLLTPELYDDRNALRSLIAGDPLLQALYSDDAFRLAINGEPFPLRSQLLAPQRTLHSLGPADRVSLHVRRSLFAANCDEPIRNTLHIQLLRDTTVVYGDEQRSKQEHLFTHQIYYHLLRPSDLLGTDYVMADLGGLLQLHRTHFLPNVLNNMLVTTQYLREYHYQKQKANAFYHIQALNLPFQNVEFYWDGEE